MATSGFGVPVMDWSPLTQIGQQLSINAELERQRELEAQAARLISGYIDAQTGGGAVAAPGLPAPVGAGALALPGATAGAVAAFGGSGVPGSADYVPPTAPGLEGAFPVIPQDTAPASRSLPTFARAQSKGPSANIRGILDATSERYGLDPEFLPRLTMIESGGNPNARNPSGAAGLLQFMPKTAKAYDLANPFNAEASADAGARLALDNRRILAKALDREPTQGELYLGHQQGAGGAVKLLTNPNARAADLVGVKAVLQNGGRADMTAAEFARLWTGRFPEGRVAVAQGGVTANDAAPVGGAPAGGGGVPSFQPGALASPPLVQRQPGVTSVPAPAATMRQFPPEQAQMLKAMAANPLTRATAVAAAQKMREPTKYDFKVIGDKLVRTNELGAAEVIGIAKDPEFSQFEMKDGSVYTFNKQDGSMRQALPAPQFRDITNPMEQMALGVQPNSGPVQRAPSGELKFPGKAQTEVNLNQAIEKTYDVDIAKENAKTFNTIQQAGRDAIKQVNTLTVMRKLLDRPDFYSGTAGALSTGAKRAFSSLGFANVDAAAPQELFASLANQAILDKAGGSLGASFSNADRTFIQGIVANPDTSVEGNKLIVEMGLRAAKREQEAAKLARDYAARNGGRIDANFTEELTRYAEANPLYADLMERPSGAPAAGTGGAPATGGGTRTGDAAAKALKPMPPRVIEEAQKAIASGRDPQGVRQKLEKLGFDPSGL
jgi:hypothetical protein